MDNSGCIFVGLIAAATQTHRLRNPRDVDGSYYMDALLKYTGVNHP